MSDFEAAYLEGERAALRAMLSHVLKALGPTNDDPLMRVARLIKEREDAVAALRTLTRGSSVGELDADEYLADIIDKRVAPMLRDASPAPLRQKDDDQ